MSELPSSLVLDHHQNYWPRQPDSSPIEYPENHQWERHRMDYPQEKAVGRLHQPLHTLYLCVDYAKPEDLLRGMFPTLTAVGLDPSIHGKPTVDTYVA
jgi:hypothetical protein